jgi:hypothetical protein|tara:strand:+ start:1146 stop:1970 length:825 start_codon:yes stop_codon:yes gene_type:complete
MVNISAFDEFGYILWYYAPVSYHHHLNNTLNSTKSKIGTLPVFYFSKNHSEESKHFDPPILERILYPVERSTSCYTHKGPNFINNNWTPPPYKKEFKNNTYIFDKPLLTIHNKNTKEWLQHPHNYFNSEILEKIINTFKNDYQIVYIRPPENSDKFKLQRDNGQTTVNIGDKEVLKRHSEVIDIEDLLKNSNKSYNEIQFMLLANSNHHITPAGDAVIPCYFGGDVLIYNCMHCNSANRGVWKTGSWMEKLSGSKIYGYNNYNDLLNDAKSKWL